MIKILYGLILSAGLIWANSDFVTYEVNGEKYEGYYISPSKNAPLVYLVHDWDGLTQYEVKRARLLYSLGYATFAVDLFGKGVRPTKKDEKKKLTKALYNDRDKMRMLLNAGLDVAKLQGANINNSVGIGYCFGGAAILEMARSGADLKSFIPFHGGLKTPEGQNYTQTKGSIFVFHGSADKSVSMQDFANLTNELETAGIPHEMSTYSGAPHAFTVFGSKRYHKKADESSWRRFIGVLDATLR